MESLAKIHAPSSDTKNLRAFHDLCETHIRGLETLGVMTESYGSLRIPILLKKIPEDIRLLIFRADPLADSSLDRLRVAIRQEIETREKSHISSPEDSTSVAMDEEVFVPTAGALQTNAQQKQQFLNGKPRVSRLCTYCAETHRPEKCDKNYISGIKAIYPSTPTKMSQLSWTQTHENSMLLKRSMYEM